MNPLTIEALTTSEVDGTGIFDKLMKGVEAHIQQEYTKNRIKGPEYSTVYLGALQSTLDQSIRFLAQRDDTLLKAKQLELLEQQILSEQAQRDLVNQQLLNLQAEALNIPKQGTLLDKQILQAEAQTLLIEQQTANALTENDLILQQKDKSLAETGLLEQKKETELAQIDGSAVKPYSVLAKQIRLYENQARGFIRDSEQKASKIMAETFNVRHSIEPGAAAPNATTNRLDDTNVGTAIEKLLAGLSDTAPSGPADNI